MHREEIEVMTKLKQGAVLPCYMSDGAAGSDVCAANEVPIIIEPGHVKLIPTGLFFEIPGGYEIQVRPRSGLALKHQITILNSPGTIDSDYRGELQLMVINHSTIPFEVTQGLRMAQIVLAKVERANFIMVERELAFSDRGIKGFGSTGL
ncbi:MAG: dUTP diphosphatase [Simkaniaceae bacterium]|nr:dUTP diphosphatase [Simkaniaceae bacterium]MCF7852489.1 dUTP diphosphatase [Simkaniaceae bacterium]